jgi:hypothetical protein
LAPAVGTAGTPVDEGLDRKLFVLLKETEALAQRENAALDAEEAAYDRIDRPKAPDALLCCDGEELVFDQRTPEGRPYCHHDIEAMKQHLVLVERVEKRNALHALPGAETYVPRMKQIVALNAEYNATDEASIQASDYPALKASLRGSKTSTRSYGAGSWLRTHSLRRECSRSWYLLRNTCLRARSKELKKPRRGC